MSQDCVEIDGSILEAGGQLLRNSLTLSVLTNTPIKIENIRANRKKPGLAEQHLKGLELVRDISRAKVVGAAVGSRAVEFRPKEYHGGAYEAIARTAGSVSLVIQVSLPCTLFCSGPSELHLQGGTNADMAPQIDYITEVFRPNLRKFGGDFDFEVVRRGYFPVGGGKVFVYIKPVHQLNPVTMLDPGQILRIYGWSFVAGTIPFHVAQRMAKKAAELLKHITPHIDIKQYQESPQVAPVGNCAGIVLVAETSAGCILGGSALRKFRQRGEEIGADAANELLAAINSGGCVDAYCQDQIIILMALAAGKSRVKVGEVTLHTKTGIHIAEKLTKATFNIIECDKGSIIECNGIGYKNACYL